MRKNCINVCLLFLLSLTSAWAQSRPYEGDYKLNTWSITVAPGLTQFYGDLRQFRSPFKRGPQELITGGLGISVNKQLSHLFGLYVNTTVGQLSGSKNQVYNAYFRTPFFFQVTGNGSANLKSLLFGTRRLQRWKADFHVGVGVMWFYTDVYSLADGQLIRYSNNRKDYSSRTAGRWEGAGSTFTREIVVPLGLNIHYELTPRFDLGIDYTYSHVNTEKLDMTVGSGIPGYNDNSSNIFNFEKGESSLDKWGFTSVTLTYKFGRNAVKVGKDGAYDATKGSYHLRWTDPKDLIKEPYNPTMNDADSIAKANMPEPVDPRLYTDTDNDGVADLFDKQPNTPQGSVVSGGGIAMNLDSVVSTLMRSKLKAECDTLLSNIEFDTDKATIRPASQESLRQIVELLNVKPNCRIVLIGHADARASDSYNQQLSKRRVEAAKRFMVRSGLNDPSRVTLEYYGEIRPIAGNKTTAGLQSNRRVEIRIEPTNSLRSRYPAGFRNKGRR